MGVSTDLLNATQADLYDPKIIGFEQRIVFYPELEKRGKVTTEKGTSIQWPIPYGAPNKVIAVDTGDETAPTDRAKKIEQYEVEPSRFFSVLSIPNLERDRNEGRRGAIKLLEKYVDTFLLAWPLALERYVHGGVSGDTDLVTTAMLSGIAPLNGQWASGTKTGLTNGFLDFRTPAEQTSDAQVVLNVAKSEAKKHYNQFQEISGSGDLLEKIRLGLRQAARWSKNGKTGPQLLELDPDSFSRFESQKEQFVRLGMLKDKMEGENPFAQVVGNARVEENHHIDLSDFTGAAAEGVGYGIDFDFLKLVFWRKPELSKWQEDQIANQDVTVAKFLVDFVLYFEKLTSQVAFAGTARR